jgi:hypothetical protein
MNILILLDLVPKYHPLLVGVGRELERAGHRVFHAMDSPQNLVRFPEQVPAGPVRVFSEHLAAMEPGRRSTDFPLTAFFPDFDRYENYGINHGRKQDWYQRLAAGLESFFDGCMHDWEIDLVLYEGVTNSYAWFASQAAARRGVRYVGLQAARLTGRHELHGT